MMFDVSKIAAESGAAFFPCTQEYGVNGTQHPLRTVFSVINDEQLSDSGQKRPLSDTPAGVRGLKTCILVLWHTICARHAANNK
jgi:hypothetical protein